MFSISKDSYKHKYVMSSFMNIYRVLGFLERKKKKKECRIAEQI